MEEFGVQVMADQRIVVADNIITSFCPETAADVGFTLLARLVGEEKAGVVRRAMGYPG